MTRSVACSAAVRFLRVYRAVVSPWLHPVCRFFPTCSEYAVEALERYGFVRGTVRAIGRLCRCHPLSPGGIDPLN
jgi:putative membrane protein insertion efficiency factor